MNEDVKLAQSITDLRFEDLPKEVVEKAKILLLDQLGCEMAFSTLPWGKSAYRYTLGKKSLGNSVIVQYGTRAGVEDAAFCNSVFGHGFEMDDVDMPTTSHPAVSIVPTVLAMGQEKASSGKEVLAAMVAGYETMLRFGRAAVTMRYRNFHATAVSGAFGAAAAAGRLLGLDATHMRDALAIATVEASGNDEYTCTGGTSKRILGAVSARSGIQSACLAKAGISGPGDSLSGKSSFVRGICTEEPDWQWFTKPFDDDYLILGVGTKPYCCCAGMHTAIDAAEEIRRQGIDIHDIEKITDRMRHREILSLGQILYPKDVVESQFCVRFAIALRLTKGKNGFYDYCTENVGDPDIIDLMHKTEYVDGGDVESMPDGDSPHEVTVYLKDGSKHSAYAAYAKGSVQVPMSNGELIDKFKDLVSRSVSSDRADAIVDTVMNLDRLETISPLTNLLGAQGGN